MASKEEPEFVLLPAEGYLFTVNSTTAAVHRWLLLVLYSKRVQSDRNELNCNASLMAFVAWSVL